VNVPADFSALEANNAHEGSSWDALHAQYEMKRVNHEEAYSLDGACTNWAEEFFSRCAGRNKAIITILRGRICFVTHKKALGAKTTAASAMVIRFTLFQGWR
jgi:hypothetical protein